MTALEADRFEKCCHCGQILTAYEDIKLCEEHKIAPSLFDLWQREFFENGGVAFRSEGNDWRFPAARRAAAGIRLVVAGLIVLSLSTTMIVGALQKGETGYKTLRMVCSLAVVWGLVFLIHAVMIIFFHRKLETVAPSET